MIFVLTIYLWKTLSLTSFAQIQVWDALRVDQKLYDSTKIDEFSFLIDFAKQDQIFLALTIADQTDWEKARLKFLDDHFATSLQEMTWTALFDLEGQRRGDDYFVDDFADIADQSWKKMIAHYAHPQRSYLETRRLLARYLRQTRYPFTSSDDEVIEQTYRKEEEKRAALERWMKFSAFHFHLNTWDELKDRYFMIDKKISMSPLDLRIHYKNLYQVFKKNGGEELIHQTEQQRWAFFDQYPHLKVFYRPLRFGLQFFTLKFSRLSEYQTSELFEKRWSELKNLVHSILGENLNVELRLFIQQAKKMEENFSLHELKRFRDQQFKKSLVDQKALKLFYMYQLAIEGKTGLQFDILTRQLEVFNSWRSEKLNKLERLEFFITNDELSPLLLIEREIQDCPVQLGQKSWPLNQFVSKILKREIQNIFEKRLQSLKEKYHDFLSNGKIPPQFYKDEKLDLELGFEEEVFLGEGNLELQSQVGELKSAGYSETGQLAFLIISKKASKIESFSSFRLQKELTKNLFEQDWKKAQLRARMKVLKRYYLRLIPKNDKPREGELAHQYLLGQLESEHTQFKSFIRWIGSQPAL